MLFKTEAPVQCFLPETLFRVSHPKIGTTVQASELRCEETVLRATNDHKVTVRKKLMHTVAEVRTVDIETAKVRLKVVDSHRIMVKLSEGHASEVRAEDLRLGTEVFTGSRWEVVRIVSHRIQQTGLVELKFNLDRTVDTFDLSVWQPVKD